MAQQVPWPKKDPGPRPDSDRKQEQAPEGRLEPGGIPAAPPGTPPPVPALPPIPFRQRGQSPSELNEVPPFALLQDDAMDLVRQFIEAQGADRGPFTLEREGQKNEQLPGLSVPPWMMQILNYIAGHPMSPYNYDRPTAHRDLLFMGIVGMLGVMQQWMNTPELRDMKHIINHEATLRGRLHVEEMLQNHFTEDLAIIARALELRMNAGQREAVYQHLRQLFEFIKEIRDDEFWRPTFLTYALKVPEIRYAIRFVGEDEKYLHDPQYEAWLDMIAAVEEAKRNWDQEYGS